MEKKIKLTKVQTIGKVVRGLREVFPNLEWIKNEMETYTKRLPRRQEYLTNSIKILLRCPIKHHVVRGLDIEYSDEKNLNLVYRGLEIAEAI